MDLYLVRHGVTTWNMTGRYQGWADPDLALEGMAQARQTAAHFAAGRPGYDHGFDAIYSSPLRRAWRTAVTIGDWLGLAPLPVPALREMSGGAVEGLTEIEWQARYPALIDGWRDPANLDFGWPEGETRSAFRDRCVHTIATLAAQHSPDDHVIVVAHGGVIGAYLGYAGLDAFPPAAAYEVGNCSITHVQLAVPTPGAVPVAQSVGCVARFNDVAHLDVAVPLAPHLSLADLNRIW